MTKIVKLALVLAVCCFGLLGCATKRNEVPYGPPAYQQGFMAGCDSGYSAAGNPYYRWQKDVMRAQSDSLYTQGWDDGFATCKAKYESVQRMMN